MRWPPSPAHCSSTCSCNVNPEDFGITNSIDVFVATVIGGLTSLGGAVAGVIIVKGIGLFGENLLDGLSLLVTGPGLLRRAALPARRPRPGLLPAPRPVPAAPGHQARHRRAVAHRRHAGRGRRRRPVDDSIITRAEQHADEIEHAQVIVCPVCHEVFSPEGAVAHDHFRPSDEIEPDRPTARSGHEHEIWIPTLGGLSHSDDEAPMVEDESLDFRGLRAATVGYSLLPLGILFTLNFVDEFDRIAFAALTPEIRDAFNLSDTGITTVAAVTSVFSLLVALPLGVLADRVNRVRLSIAAGFLWGIAAVATGLVWAVPLLYLVRFLSGVGRINNEVVHPVAAQRLLPGQGPSPGLRRPPSRQRARAGGRPDRRRHRGRHLVGGGVLRPRHPHRLRPGRRVPPPRAPPRRIGRRRTGRGSGRQGPHRLRRGPPAAVRRRLAQAVLHRRLLLRHRDAAALHAHQPLLRERLRLRTRGSRLGPVRPRRRHRRRPRRRVEAGLQRGPQGATSPAWPSWWAPRSPPSPSA